MAAGKLLNELGKGAFLEKYGKGSIMQMKKGVVAEFKRRKAAGRDQEVSTDVKKRAPRVVVSKSSESSEDPVKPPPRRKRNCSRL